MKLQDAVKIGCEIITDIQLLLTYYGGLMEEALEAQFQRHKWEVYYHAFLVYSGEEVHDCFNHRCRAKRITLRLE